jgi:argininosuccinate lyase
VSSGFINATDLADYLVLKGVPFREAHGIVGASVRYCIENKKKLEELELGEFKKFSDLIDKDVYDAISIENCVERRNSEGGTSSQSTDLQLMQAIQEYMQREEVVRQENDLIDRCWDELLQ